MNFRKIIATGCLSLVAAVLGVLFGATALYLYFTMDSFGSSSWRHRLEAELNRHSEVRFADLVDFDWDKVFLIGAYDLTYPMRLEIFGADVTLEWANAQEYLTVIYRRPRNKPFIVKMDYSKWSLRPGFPLQTSDKEAKLKAITQSSPDYLDCIPPRGRCLFIENSKKNTPER